MCVLDKTTTTTYGSFRAPVVASSKPGSYHVVSRGNNRQPIFDDVLRKGFLVQLGLVARLFDWQILAWALMTNHFHLGLDVGQEGLAKGMHRLNLAFAIASNARFGRINHCFGNRYWSKDTPVESDRHLYNSVRYALWNPARAGVVTNPFESDWTSRRASAGLDPAPPVLSLNRLLSQFRTGVETPHSPTSSTMSSPDGTAA